MHRRSLFVALALVAAHAAAAGAEPRTVAGEVIDVQCHRRQSDNVGDGHVDCALSCAKKGARMGILAEDGVYIITGEYTAENNRRLLEFVAREVEATGEVTEKDGTKTIKVASMKMAD